MRGLSAEEADAISGLLGVRRPTDGMLKVSLVSLDQALRTSSVGRGLFEVLAIVGGPLTDRRAARSSSAASRDQVWSELASHPAVLQRPGVAEWLALVRSSGLARRLAGDQEGKAVSLALDVVGVVGGDERRLLPVLAAEITGDAHGLDRGRPAGTLAVHGLTWLAGRPFPADAADWRRAWSDAGVACDDLSCDVLVLNLPGWPAEPLRLTLRQVAAWHPVPTGPVFVCENPAVVAAADDELGKQSPTLVCVDGMPSTAALDVLRALAAGGAAICYHGDFDWRGLAIAGVLFRKVPAARAWRFGAADYRDAVRRGFGTVPLTGLATSSSWDPDLQAAMIEAGVAVYEEQLVAALINDLGAVAATTTH
jgi:uncharacterized protein (TIGR02679 family)